MGITPREREGETKLKKIPKQECAAEFRELAAKRVKEGQSIGAPGKTEVMGACPAEHLA